ncbi:MAG: Pectate lyase superfamily protein [Acidobacteriota bacterium]|nr:Pectate lyase superfamily protein [Acidobacteriota bacterium]
MVDILNDPPMDFQVFPPVNPNEAREALLALNQLAFGLRGAPGLKVRSVAEDGAVPDGTDQLAAFQTTVDTVAAAGGGIALVPPTYPNIYHLNGTLTIPANVILSGLGDLSVIRKMPGKSSAAIRFAPGEHRGGLENLQIWGTQPSSHGIGIDLSGAQFLRLRNFQVWYFEIGLCLSDGVTSYAGQNHVSDFEINVCHTGIKAWMHCNQVSVANGRIWFCRNNGAGTAIDIAPPKPADPMEPFISAEALAIAHVAVEEFDVGVRIAGRTHVSLRDIYYEADTADDPNDPDDTFPLGFWMDIRPEKGSTVLMENSIANPSRSLVLGGSLEDAITNDERSHIFNGAKRHHAAAPERNLFENGDFHRGDGKSMLGWKPSFEPAFAENKDDFVTGGRSYDITQASDANDAMITFFTVPETTDYITVMLRYKNISSVNPRFVIGSGDNKALYDDTLPPSEDEWRVAAVAVEVDRSAAGVVSVLLAPDLSAGGGRIRVDEVWAVVGATAAPPRAHAHRFEILPDPITVVTRAALKADAEFAETDLTQLQGLAQPPRGVIGAILSLRGTATPAGRPGSKDDLLDASGIGATLPRAVRPFIQELLLEDGKLVKGQKWSLDIIYDRLEHDRQVVLRGTLFMDGIKVFNGSMSTNYRVELVGWVLPS